MLYIEELTQAIRALSSILLQINTLIAHSSILTLKHITSFEVSTKKKFSKLNVWSRRSIQTSVSDMKIIRRNVFPKKAAVSQASFLKQNITKLTKTWQNSTQLAELCLYRTLDRLTCPKLTKHSDAEESHALTQFPKPLWTQSHPLSFCQACCRRAAPVWTKSSMTAHNNQRFRILLKQQTYFSHVLTIRLKKWKKCVRIY